MVTSQDLGLTVGTNPNEITPYIGLLQDDVKLDQIVTKTEIARSYYQLGKVYYDKADLVQAEESFVKALTFADPIKDGFSVLKTYGFLIRIASEKLEDSKAQKYINESEKLMDTLSRALPTLSSEFFYNFQEII